MSRSWLSILAVFGACTPFDPQLSGTPFFCGADDPKCPDGYACVASASGGKSVCTSTGDAPGIDGGAHIDGTSGTCAMAFTGALATWNMTSESGTQASTAATSPAPGVTATSLMRATTLMAATGTGSINASGWPTTGQPDPTKYFTLALGAPAGCVLDLTSIAIDVKSSGTGPANATLSTSADAFAHTDPVSTSAPTTQPVSVSGAMGMVEVRVFGFAASAATGTMRIQNQLVVSGVVR